METKSTRIRELFALAPVIPALVISQASHARPLAQSLITAGLPVLEVTLRTPASLDALSAMARLPDCIVGAGTLVTPADVRAAKAAGAQFGVSPGVSNELIEACEAENLPFLPGVATVTEAMALLARGYDALKFFPAESSGGLPGLRSISAALPRISFCPSGGLSIDTAKAYLSLASVVCVGGNWMAPEDRIQAQDWPAIEALAREAATLAA